MNKTDIIHKLKEIINTNPTNFSNNLHKKENDCLLKWIYDNIPDRLKTGSYNLSTILYWIVNDIEDFPRCKICGNKLRVGKNIIFTKGYPPYCKRCSPKSTESINKKKKTCIEKYGVDNPFKSRTIQKKIRSANIQKYGTACPAQSKENQEKIKKENLKKYGTEFYQSTTEYKNKVKETCLRKYGVSDVFHVDEIKNKIKKTLIDKYGVDHNMKSKFIKDKKEKHLIEKYGEDYRNVLWGNKGNIGQSRRAYKFILNNPNVEPLFSENEFVNGKTNNINTKFPFRCKKCGNEFMSIWDNGGTRVCPKCNQSKGTSDEENELFEYIHSITNNKLLRHERNIINPLELDIVDNSRNICFEFDGLYWHCDDVNHNKRYHLLKTENCEKLGYQLIHIFENEWIYKKEIVKSRISNLYGKYDFIRYARQCDIREVDFKTCHDFLEYNHLQGWCSSSINLGLFYKNELVSVMTFGKPRFNKKYEWELLRFCNKLNYHVIGGAGKLLKYFERNYHPKSLISYADRRWSVGNLYLKLGFEHILNTIPNYWYIDFHNLKLFSRVKFQKHKLHNILENYNENISESENMKNNGYGRIYDCGNMVFVKSYNT